MFEVLIRLGDGTLTCLETAPTPQQAADKALRRVVDDYPQASVASVDGNTSWPTWLTTTIAL